MTKEKKKEEEKEPQKKKLGIEDFVKKTRKDLTGKIKEKYSEKAAEQILGGKQLRGVLVVLSWRAAGGKDEDYPKALETAAAVEGMHGSSLMLDDIFDVDETRRDKPTLWMAEGVGKAVLDAHHAITTSLDIVLNRGVDIMRSVLGGWSDAIEGEKKDIGLVKKIGEQLLAKEPIPEEVYFGLIKKKSASLFSTAAKGGAQVAEAPEEVTKHLSDYGENLGMAYQIADDLTDIKAGKIEGAAVIPLLVVAKGENAVRNKLFSVLLGEKAKVGDFLKDVDINPRDFLVTNLKKYLKKAEELAGSDTIPESEYKNMLKEYAKYATKGILKEGDVRVKL